MALEIQFKQLGTDKWRLLGDDGNEFETAEEAWREAQAAADLGIPWGGASFRLVDNDAAEHSDDCPIGLGRMNACDCGAARVVEERRLWPPGAIQEGKLALSSTYGAIRQRSSMDQLLEMAGGRVRMALPESAVEGVLEPKDEEKGGA